MHSATQIDGRILIRKESFPRLAEIIREKFPRTTEEYSFGHPEVGFDDIPSITGPQLLEVLLGGTAVVDQNGDIFSFEIEDEILDEGLGDIPDALDAIAPVVENGSSISFNVMGEDPVRYVFDGKAVRKILGCITFPVVSDSAGDEGLRPGCPDPHREVDVLKFLEDNSLDLRCINVPTGGDDFDVAWIVIEHYMAEPWEREIGRGDSPVAAVQTAMAEGKP